MIVIPALAGIVAILEPIIVGATVGVMVSGGFCAAGGAVSEIHDQGSPSEVASSAVQATQYCAEDGTLVEAGLIGGVFGGVAHVAGPVLNAVGGAAKPLATAADDVLSPAVRGIGSVVDDLGRSIWGALDDIGSRLGFGANKVANAARNAQNYRSLPKAVCNGGCLYIMDDAAHGLSKIGVTKHPVKRLAAVQRDVGSKLRYVGISPVDDVYQVEAALHRQLVSKNVVHPKHLTGTEWFRGLSPSDVAGVLSR